MKEGLVELDGAAAAALSELIVQRWEGSVLLFALTAQLQDQYPQARLMRTACHLLNEFCHAGRKRGLLGR